ncbi:MAG: hypothetical protein AAGD47_13760 [Pseudomonadota bacterium]
MIDYSTYKSGICPELGLALPILEEDMQDLRVFVLAAASLLLLAFVSSTAQAYKTQFEPVAVTGE